MVSPVTDPLLLQQLNAAATGGAPTPQAVTDPLLLKQLNDAATSAPPPEAAKPGWMDYVFRGAPMNAILGIGDALKRSEIDPALATPEAEAYANASGRQAANQSIYGAPEIQPPSDSARYGGAVTSAFAANPVFGALTPGYTAAGALGSEVASDYKPSWMPDWAARLLGGAAGGGIYGTAKAGVTGAAGRISDAYNGVDRTAANVADVKARIAAGEGPYGEIQQLAGKASDSLQKDAAGMPTLSPDTKVPLQNTWNVLNRGGPSSPIRDQLREALTPDGAKITAGQYGNHLDWMKAAGGTDPALYGALKSDLKGALTTNIGADAPAAFDKANLARQGLFMLDKAQTPSGFYDPTALTKALAKRFNGEDISAINPEMDALTSKASDFYDAQSPWMRANMPQPSAIRQIGGKLAGLGGSLAAGKFLGNPELGAMVGGSFLHSQEPSQTVNQFLYGLPRPSLMGRAVNGILPLAPSVVATTPGLLSPQQQN